LHIRRKAEIKKLRSDFFMSKFTSPLDSVSVASPCSQDWNQMIGGEQKRYCGDCKLNVYNLSGMTRGEAEKLILNSEGHLCVRFFRRADGTILTKDCPVGWQALKRRVSRTAAAAFSLFVGLIGGLGFATAFKQNDEAKIGTFLPVLTTPTPRVLMGNISPLEPSNMTMGAVSMPTPKSSPKAEPKNENYEVGKVLIKRN
jgi:hypothetical protein